MAVNIGVNIQRNPNRIDRTYDVIGKSPNLVADFEQEYYRKSGGSTSLTTMMTHAATTNATMTDGYGPELVTNGTFDSSDGWDGNPAWTIGSGVATGSAASGSLFFRDVNPIAGKTYIVEFDCIRTSGTLYTTVGGNFSGQYSATASKRHSIAIVAGPTASRGVEFYGGAFTGSIDNVSVREMPVIKWRPHNLLTYSEDFSNAAWANTTTTITVNAAVAPDGTTTATEITHTSTNAYFGRGIANTQNVLTKVAVFAKYVDHRWLRFYNGAGSTYFDLQNGVIGIDESLGSTITSVGNGWYLCAMEVFVTASNASATILLADNNGSAVEQVGTSAYIWGAHAYRSDLGGMVDNPERGDSYVRTAGRPIGPELWTDIPTTVGTGWIDNGDGSYTCDGLVSITQVELLVPDLKDGDIVSFSFDVTDYSSGVIAVAALGSTLRTAFQGTNSNGTFTFTVPITTATGVVPKNAIILRAEPTFNGTISNISVKQADVNPAIPRYMPRIGHHIYNGYEWVNEGLLHESEARTNLVSYSESFDNAYWTKSYVTLSASDVIAPDGTYNGFKIVEDTSTNPRHISRGSGLLANSTQYTVSVYLKKGTRTKAKINIYIGTTSHLINFDLENGLVYSSSGATSSSIKSVGNDWYLCSATTTTASTGVPNVAVGPLPDDYSTVYTGNGSYIYVYGAQVEAASTPSSYIPTSGAAVTRAVESLTIPAANLPYNPLSVSIQMAGRMTYADNNTAGSSNGRAGEAVFVSWFKDTSNMIEQVLTTNTGAGELVFSQKNLGTLDVVIGNAAYSPDIFVPLNIASRHGSTFINGAVDGIALTADTTPVALPDLSATPLSLGYDYMGTISQFRMWDKDINDTGIVEVTSPSLEPTLSLSFDETASSYTNTNWSE